MYGKRLTQKQSGEARAAYKDALVGSREKRRRGLGIRSDLWKTVWLAKAGEARLGRGGETGGAREKREACLEVWVRRGGAPVCVGERSLKKGPRTG